MEDPFFTQAIGPRMTVREVESFITEKNGSLRCRECEKGKQLVEHSLDNEDLAFLGGLLTPDQSEVELLLLTACDHCGNIRTISASALAEWRGTRA